MRQRFRHFLFMFENTDSKLSLKLWLILDSSVFILRNWFLLHHNNFKANQAQSWAWSCGWYWIKAKQKQNAANLVCNFSRPFHLPELVPHHTTFEANWELTLEYGTCSWSYRYEQWTHRWMMPLAKRSETPVPLSCNMLQCHCQCHWAKSYLTNSPFPWHVE